MNVYDHARELANAIKNSEEYNNYMTIKDKASENSQLTEIINDFQQKQFALQAKMMMGEDTGEDMMEQVQALNTIIMADPLAAQYMQSQIRFSMMINDVYKILGDVLQFGRIMEEEEDD